MRFSPHARAFEYFNKHMLSPSEVVKRGLKVALQGVSNPDEIKKNFSRFVFDSEGKTYEFFLDAQNEAWRRGLEDFTQKIEGPNLQTIKARFLTENLKELDSFFLSLSQSRRVRAGLAFQYIIRDLFKRLNYPFTEEPIINGQPDFLLPNHEHYRKIPIDCVIFTVKRTLRERWRQIVTEGTRGLGFYLATMDDLITQNQLNEIAGNRIYLVVPEKVKAKTERYRTSGSVMTFETFFEDVLDPKMKHWKRDGVIL